jgi:ATP synthase protein I
MRAGAELVGSIGASAFIGWGLDKWFETQPVLMIIMLLIGICTGFYNVWRTTQNISPGGGFSQLQNKKKNGTTPADEKPNKNA